MTIGPSLFLIKIFLHWLGGRGSWPTPPNYFFIFIFITTNIFLKYSIFDRRSRIIGPQFHPGYGGSWPDFYEIASTLTFQVIKSSLRLWPALNFTYKLGLTNHSHRCDQDDKIFNLKLSFLHFHQSDFWAFMSPLCHVCVSRATWIILLFF